MELQIHSQQSATGGTVTDRGSHQIAFIYNNILLDLMQLEH